jgi:hypothetical protein
MNLKEGGVKMNRLKNETTQKCLSLLRDFIEESSSLNSKKGIAVLALSQLQRVTAGSSPDEPEPGCKPSPRIPVIPGDGSG